MENDAPATQASQRNQPTEGAHVTGNVNTEGGDFVGRDQIIHGDEVHGDKVGGDKITADFGPGAQNVVVGSGNTQIIGYTAEQVAVIITQIRRNDQPQGWNGRTPYIGLDSFSEQQANLFFGREKLVTHLLTRVQETRFLCITGPSGSGKSSLVQAGLIPALRIGKLASSEQWLFETVRPGNQPVENLALAMGRMAKSPTASEYFRTHSATDPLTLNTQMEAILSHQPNQRAVIVVDQFEEIFTQTKDEALRLKFLALLTHAVQHADGRISVFLNMRSDFVSQCATYADLRQLISGHLELVGAMEPEELARAIALPALEVGVEVKPELVAQVINDMRSEPGALPLMQFALKDLFDAQSKQLGKPVVLTLQEYLTRGGIQQALERHADAQFAKFSQEEQRIAQQIFMSLIEVGHGTVDTRRTAAFSELFSPGGDTGKVERVVQILANARLITTDNPQSTQAISIEGDTRNVTIAHEKLIEAWPWLQQLARENRALIELQNQINEHAVEWNDHKRDVSYLYTGARLQTVQEQLATNQLMLSALAKILIDDSVQAEEKRLQQREEERQRELDHQRRLADEQRQRADDREQANTRLRNRARLMAGLGLLALLLAAAAGWFGIQSNRNATVAQAASTAALKQKAIAETEKERADQKAQEAEAERATAQRNAQIALSRQLASQSANESNNSHNERAILLAIESGRAADTFEAFTVIRMAIANAWHAQTISQGHTARIEEAIWSHDDSKILTGDDDGAAHIWDASSGKLLVTLTGHTNSILQATWSRDDNKILTCGWDHTARIWDASSGKLLATLTSHTNAVDEAIWSHDESKILTTDYDNTARIWDATSGKLLVTFNDINKVAWSHDDSKILTTGWDDATRIWDAASGKLLVTLNEVNEVVWSHDDSKILTSSKDGTAHIWDAASGKLLISLNNVFAAQWSNDDSKILTGSDNGTARIWDAANGKLLVTLTEPTKSIRGATWRPNDNEILTWDDNTASIWDAASGKLRTTLNDLDRIEQAMWSPKGSMILLTIDKGNTARIWDAASGKLRTTLNEVNEPTWSHDDSKILTRSNDNTVRIWDTSSGKEFDTLTSRTNNINQVTWSHDDSKILLRSSGDSMRIWDMTSGKLLFTLNELTKYINQATWSHDGSKILTTDWGDAGRIWDAASGQELVKLAGHMTYASRATWSHNDSKILTTNDNDSGRILTDSPDDATRIWDATSGKRLATLTSRTNYTSQATWSHDDNKILTYNSDITGIWDATSGKLLATLIGHTSYVSQVTWNHDDNKILTVSSDNTARIWDATSGKLLVTFNDINKATWSLDESKILTASSDNTAHIWDVTSGKLLITLIGHMDSVNEATWSRDESKILTSSDDGTARIWDAASGKLLATLIGHTARITQATWSHDESKIVTASEDNTARIWDAASGQLLAMLIGHTARITQAMWSHDDSKIVTASIDSTARIWDTASGKLLARLTGHTNGILQVRWSHDDSKIVTSNDETVRIWYVRMQDLISAACHWTSRNMTENEWGLYMEGPYRPTCPTVPIPADAIEMIQTESKVLIQEGKIISATQRLEQLNGWLKTNDQVSSYGVDVSAFIAKYVTSTPQQPISPLSTQLPSPLTISIIAPTPNITPTLP